VNAASLALLLGDTTGKAQHLAARVAELCRQPQALTKDEPFWVYATEGEAALVLGDYCEAYDFYRNALDEAGAEVQHVQAAYYQVCRLWYVRDQKEIGRLVDEVFARYPSWQNVKAGPVGGCGGRR
jgi:hypothetical protein